MKKEEILARCLDEIENGKSTVEECLARHPGMSRELRPLLEIAALLRSKRRSLAPAFRDRFSSRLMEASPTRSRGRGAVRFLEGLRIPRLSGAMLAVTLSLVILATGSTVYAAQESLPGDRLYPVKLATENIKLATTLNHQSRTSLYLQLARRRLDEVSAQYSQGKQPSPATVETLAGYIDSGLKEISDAAPREALAFTAQLARLVKEQEQRLSEAADSGDGPEPVLQQALLVTRQGQSIAEQGQTEPSFLQTAPSVRESLLAGRTGSDDNATDREEEVRESGDDGEHEETGTAPGETGEERHDSGDGERETVSAYYESGDEERETATERDSPDGETEASGGDRNESRDGDRETGTRAGGDSQGETSGERETGREGSSPERDSSGERTSSSGERSDSGSRSGSGGERGDSSRGDRSERR